MNSGDQPWHDDPKGEAELICTCGSNEANGYNDALTGKCSIHYKREYLVCDHKWFQAGLGIRCEKCDKIIYDINLNNEYEV